MSRDPVNQLAVGRALYDDAGGGNTDYFPGLWHLFTLGHLVESDLDRVARHLGLSFADLDLLGILPTEFRQSPRAVDLAAALYLSPAAVSNRIKRLERQGLVVRRRCDDDQRAFELELTELGHRTITDAIKLVSAEARIVSFLQDLPEEDRVALDRILGHLHRRYDREFIGTPREE